MNLMLFSAEPSELDHLTDLAALSEVATGCNACRLRSGCTQVVFGEGVPTAKLMCVGEGPGADEDRLGRPFVGRAGQLLDRILEVSGFDRKQNCYIANIVKCRPPGNRAPEPDERKACWPYLQAQIRLIQPRIIILLGATALQTLIDPQARITRMRGQWIEKEGILFMPTYHPAALLRDPRRKKEVWEDMKLVIHKYQELVDPNHTSPYL